MWSPYVIGQAIILSSCGFFYLSIYLLFFSPNLSRRRVDVCHTCTHGVALVRISDAGLKPAALGSLKTQDAKKSSKTAIWAPSHSFLGYIFAIKACIGNRKKLVEQQYLLHMPHNMVNFGPLTAEIGSEVWGTPANFNGFRVLTALLHGI